MNQVSNPPATPGSSVPDQAPSHVRAILLATQETLALLFDVAPTFGEARVCSAQTPRESETSVIVGFTGAVQGQILLGIVYDPLRHELFSARYRKGAWLGKRRLALDPAITLNAALIGFDIGYDDAVAGEALGWASRLWPGPQSFRIMGSAALGLAYVAAGRLDLYFHLRLYPWDTAAGMLLVREAGGLVTDRHGGPADLSSRSCVAAAAPLLKSFCSRLEQPGTLARASPAPEPLDPRSRVPNRPKE